MIISRKILILLVVLGCYLPACDIRYGLLESQFTLSQESRLPNWIRLPLGVSRKDVDITFEYYSNPLFGTKVVIYVSSKTNDRTLIKLVGNLKWHPITEKKGIHNYPIYEIITVNNVSEVVEHRKPGDIIFVVDNPQE